ncbi:hypothetical protein Ac2012v2_005946, partial [Leucoagaricus gongylophorus]
MPTERAQDAVGWMKMKRQIRRLSLFWTQNLCAKASEHVTIGDEVLVKRSQVPLRVLRRRRRVEIKGRSTMGAFVS